MYAKGIDFASLYYFDILFWNCSDRAVFCFYFINQSFGWGSCCYRFLSVALFVLFVYITWFVYTILPLSLYCTFLIAAWFSLTLNKNRVNIKHVY